MTPPIRMVSVPVETLRVALDQAKRGADKAGCDGWRSQEMCRQIVQLLEPLTAAPVREEGGAVLRIGDRFETDDATLAALQSRATEAERKLAEAVELLREWMGTWFVDADGRGENAIADDTRKFLSKEAERG